MRPPARHLLPILLAVLGVPGARADAPAEPPQATSPGLPVAAFLDGALSAGIPATAGGLRAGVRVGPLEGMVGFDTFARHATHIARDTVVLIGPGLVLDRGDWLAHAAGGLGARAYEFEDVWGTGSSGAVVGAFWIRAGLVRRFPAGGRFALRAGVEATLVASARDEERFRRATLSSGLAYCSFTLGLEVGARLR